jgi:hypothetical protein
MPKNRSMPTRWGGVSTFAAPSSALGLSGRSLAVLLLLYRDFNQRHRGTHSTSNGDVPSIKISQAKICARTGLGRTSVSSAVADLVERRFIRVDRDRKGQSRDLQTHRQLFGVSRYEPLNPNTRLPLVHVSGKSLLYANGQSYFRVPTCVIQESDAQWSIAKLSSAELRAYVSILSFSSWNGAEFEADASALRKRSGIKTSGTFRASVDELKSKGLVWATRTDDKYKIIVCDPYTGEKPHVQTDDSTDDPYNYIVKRGKRADGRFNFNEAYRDPDYIERLLRSCLKDGKTTVIQTSLNGNLTLRCPFHDDDTPSCSVSPDKQVFKCHGCGKKGRITDFVRLALDLSEQDAHRHKRQLLGSAAIYRQRRDTKATAIYSYMRKGKLIKQKLRFDKVGPDGTIKKDFVCRRPASGGGFIGDWDGVAPLLYNHDWLKIPGVVIICEGEKDCDNLMELKNEGVLEPTMTGMTVAVTSGGATSWSDSLADDLVGKHIVIMPDADTEGHKYRDAIADSPRRRGISYRVVDFAPFGVKDVSEWLAAGHDADELANLINEAPIENSDEGGTQHDDWIMGRREERQPVYADLSAL